MRFIHPLSHEILQLLNRVHKQSRHHRVRQRTHCIVLSSQGYTTTHLADIFQVDRIGGGLRLSLPPKSRFQQPLSNRPNMIREPRRHRGTAMPHAA